MGINSDDFKIDNGVIVICPNGDCYVRKLDDNLTRHWMCYDEIEQKLGISNDCGNNQMEHAWFLGNLGYITIQIAKDICYIIVSPYPEDINNVQLINFKKIISDCYKDVTIFGIDYIKDGDHKPVLAGDKFEYGYDVLESNYGFDKISEKRK